ncbi:MAG: class II fumarate hydratase, partial [Burkholderiales bacterium PBB4]
MTEAGGSRYGLAQTLTDSFGTVEIPYPRKWGTQTARSLHYFAIGTQRMPLELIHALARIKWAAAKVNAELNLLHPETASRIAAVALEIVRGD